MRASSFSSSWPDLHSPVLSKINFGVPLPDLLNWLHARDTFLGDNYEKQDFTAAWKLARDCKHPDAVWLTSVCENVSTKEQAKQVFLLRVNDARALCFAWWLSDDGERDLNLLRRAAEMGYALACSTLCEMVDVGHHEYARLAEVAAAHQERNGFYGLGRCYRLGFGCEKDLRLANEKLSIAAELGHVSAARCYGDLLDVSNPVPWVWWGRAALRGAHGPFLRRFSKQVEQFFSGSENAPIVFLIGQTLKGNINMEKSEILCFRHWKFDSVIRPANQAVSFYESQIQSARLAVYTWMMVSTRLYLIKDMRILIGKMIWEARFEANYKI